MLVGQQIGSGAYRFDIEQELGSGAMGTVYRAKFHKDEKVIPVALKVVALGLLGNEGAMARFDREANILKQLRHPHIVRLYATGHYRKTPFIAMEYIDGEALDRALARRGRLTWEEVVAYGKQLCEALQHAHEKGIIHRDLKPSNLMITRDGTLKLTDFGIAKDTDVTALTGMNSTIGTAAYMSPEQCKGDKNLTPKSDLYSLGICFFELLSGKKPFYADTTVDMFLKHVNEKPPRIGKIVPDLPPKLEALILQLLEKDKEDRPTDAAWVGRMLQEVEEDAFARKSAGLDAATARKVDRPRGTDTATIDESDREAARALKGKKKKKKKAGAAVPWYQQNWAKAAGLGSALVALGLVAYFGFIKAAPPGKMFAAVEGAKSPEDRLQAAEAYLRKYGDRPGEMTDKAAAAFREGKVREREKQLANRLSAKMTKPDEKDDKEAYEAAWNAMELEKAGKLREAADYWVKVKGRFPDDAKVPFTFEDDKLARARWGWVADKRLKDIEAVRDLHRRLAAKIDENRRFEKPTPFEPSNPESVAIKAIRLDQFQDKEKAARVWQSLVDMTEKEPDQRVWYLLACEHRAKIPPDAADNAVGKRTNLTGQALGEAERLAQAGEGARARFLCRQVIELYEDETDRGVLDAVERAKKILAAASKG